MSIFFCTSWYGLSIYILPTIKKILKIKYTNTATIIYFLLGILSLTAFIAEIKKIKRDAINNKILMIIK